MPGSRAARLQAHEALQHALAIVRRDAGAAVGDDELDAIAVAARRAHRRRSAAPFAAGARAVLDGVVDQVGDGLADELPVGAHRDAVPAVDDIERQPASSATGS